MRNDKTALLVLVVFGLSFVLGLVGMNSLAASLRGSTMRLGIDLYPRWVGTEAMLDGVSPYGPETRQRIWQAIYGSPDLPEDANPFGFYYPPAITTLLLPFVLAGLSLELAAVIWCAVLWAAWSTLLLLWIGRPAPGAGALVWSVLLLITGLLFRPAFSSYILGQSSLLCVAMLAAAWVAYQKQAHFWVGVLAALSLLKPSLTILPVLVFFLAYYRNRQGYVAFLVTSLILYVPPTLMMGWWVPDFLNDIGGYALENGVGWSAMDIVTPSGLIWLLAAAYLIWRGWSDRDPVLVLSSVLALNAIFVPHTADYDLVIFVGLLAWLGERWRSMARARWAFSLGFLALVLWPWISLLLALQTGAPSAVESWYRFIWLTYPVLLLVLAAATESLTRRQRSLREPVRAPA